jgi:hypothetical protein
MKGHESKMKVNEWDMNAKWKARERKWMQNERRRKEIKTKYDIRWLSTKDALTHRSWKTHTNCLQGVHKLRKRWVKRNDNVILGHLKRYRVFIQPHVVPNMISCSQPDLGPILPVSVLSRWLNCASSSPNPRRFKAKKHNRGMSSFPSP